MGADVLCELPCCTKEFFDIIEQLRQVRAIFKPMQEVFNFISF